MEADQGRVDVVGTEERARHPRVLGGYKRHLAQDAQGAQGDVFEIANRRRHHVQRPHVEPIRAPESGRYTFQMLPNYTIGATQRAGGE